MTNYYDGWEKKTYTCPACGWQGVGNDCHKGHVYEMLFGLDCPNCGEEIDAISFPTIQETNANWDKASEADRLMAKLAEKGYQDLQDTMLRSAQQLPEISGDQLILVWDYESPKMFESWTVIRYGDMIIWRESCGWEIYERFMEVLGILKEKYGKRLIDVVPTIRSLDTLYGDRLSASSQVDNARASLRE